MNDFSYYAPLPDARQWTRLIEMRSNRDSDSVECALTAHKLDNLPPYHAISYLWGNPPDTDSVLLNGKEKQVRHNCSDALRQARHHGESRYHWIDSLCINQEDRHEKGCQVEIMGEIFDRATRVLSCIGQHADDSDFVLQVLGGCPLYLLQRTWNASRSDMVFNAKAMLRLLSKSRDDIKRLSTGRAALLSRQYFRRVWMMQEVFRKQVRVTLCCGLDHQPLSALFGLSHTVRILANPRDPKLNKTLKTVIHCVFKTRIAAIDSRFRYYNYPSAAVSFLLDVSCPGRRHSNRAGGLTTDDGRDGLEEVLEMVSECGCQDPRDRVFGTRMLVDWGSEEPIVPDYSMSRFDLALEVLRRSWRAGRYLNLSTVAKTASALSVDLEDDETRDAILNVLGKPKATQAITDSDSRTFSPWLENRLQGEDVQTVMSEHSSPGHQGSTAPDCADLSRSVQQAIANHSFRHENWQSDRPASGLHPNVAWLGLQITPSRATTSAPDRVLGTEGLKTFRITWNPQNALTMAVISTDSQSNRAERTLYQIGDITFRSKGQPEVQLCWTSEKVVSRASSARWDSPHSWCVHPLPDFDGIGRLHRTPG